jgi:GDP-4-dehydro-6-deoxy-D-mannose reductase
MRALVTGGNGFVGSHLCRLLSEQGNEVAIAGRSHDGGDVDLAFDLGDAASVRSVVESSRPDVVFHLAAQAFVPESTLDPLATYDANVMGTARLYEAIRQVRSDDPPRVLFASSAEVYGARSNRELPLREEFSLRPATPYAASKAAGEAIAFASWRTYGVPTVVTRAFNHIGPGQDERFAVPAFAKQLAAIAAGVPPVMYVGNLAAQRDFLDVRDVVAAYVALVERGEPGEVYNVCSGRPVAIQEVLRRLIMTARVAVEVREDAARMRPSDTPVSYGDPARLQAATGWSPLYSLDQSLRAVYADARERVAAQ